MIYPGDSLELKFYTRMTRIPEQDNRMLRVTINTRVAPSRVVSVFFDRNMKGKL